ncbi:hypothetical protein AZE42_01509 [Rhizopogon vesiculosus]|uniref:Uncharacterized protein n=1 Tax=Rhizopogon vesiculosus TaxID=180088 RepID=A0A1J8QGE6_9AGAM|nr:hypothetical protein AZE42_01509 [Rhizopogon vesiculosus]
MFTVWIVHFLYAYRIWIGICSSINQFTTAYLENIVSTGRSRVLPITVGIVVTLALG